MSQVATSSEQVSGVDPKEIESTIPAEKDERNNQTPASNINSNNDSSSSGSTTPTFGKMKARKSVGWKKLKKMFEEDADELKDRVQMKATKSHKGIILVAQHVSEHRWELIQNWFKLNYDISEAMDGHTLTTMLDEGYDNDYRALVLEVDLPVMDGIAVVEYVRNVYKSKIPIIIVSHNDDYDKMKNALEFGADTFLKKPYTSQQFEEVTRKLKIENRLPKETKVAPIHDMATAVKRLMKERSTIRVDPRRKMSVRRQSEAEIRAVVAKDFKPPRKKAEPHLLASKSFSQHCDEENQRSGSFQRVLIVDSATEDKEEVDANTYKDIGNMKKEADWGGKTARNLALYGDKMSSVKSEKNKNNEAHENSNKLVKMLKDLNLLVCEWSELKYGVDADSLMREVMSFYSCVILVLRQEDLRLDLYEEFRAILNAKVPLFIKASESVNIALVEDYVRNIIDDYKRHFNKSLTTDIESIKISALSYDIAVDHLRHILQGVGVVVRRQTIEERLRENEAIIQIKKIGSNDDDKQDSNNDKKVDVIMNEQGEDDLLATKNSLHTEDPGDWQNDDLPRDPRPPDHPRSSSFKSTLSPNVRQRSRTDSTATVSTVDSAVTEEDDDHKYMLNIQRVRDAEYMQEDFLASLDISPEPGKSGISSSERFAEQPLVAYISPRDTLSPRKSSSPPRDVRSTHAAAEEFRSQKSRRKKVDEFLSRYSSRQLSDSNQKPMSAPKSPNKKPSPLKNVDIGLVSVPVMLYGNEEDTVLPIQDVIAAMNDEDD